MNKVLEEISKIGIVPVIALDHVEDAAPLAKALCDGGLPCAEVTFRTAAAEESIRIMAEQFPEMLVGAGTVLTTEQVDRAVNAGAKFIVSPGLNPKVVKYCVEKGIPVTPGCSNPSDVEVAIELGLDVVKFFPAEAAGGLNMIKSMATGLKQAGKDLKGKETLEDADVVQIFASYEAGVAKLGEAKVGDKTFLDGLHPAVESLQASLAAGESLADMAGKAADAAEEGFKATTTMLAVHGRAATRGEASRSLEDPGAKVASLIMQAFAKSL